MRIILVITLVSILSSCVNGNSFETCFIDIQNFDIIDSTTSCGTVIKEGQRFIYLSKEDKDDTLRVLRVDNLTFGDTQWKLVDSTVVKSKQRDIIYYYAIPVDSFENTSIRRIPVLVFDKQTGLIGLQYLDGSLVIQEKLEDPEATVKKIKTIANTR